MKTGLLLLLLLLVSEIRNRQHAPSAASASAAIVCWQEGRKLTWDDFQAKQLPPVPEADTLFGAFVEAVTEADAVVYDWTTVYGEYVKTVVRVEFYKEKSWVNQVNVFDRPATLRHEQLHFDIVELTGRRIRRVLARCAARRIDYHTPAITAEITAIYNAEIRLNGRYDREAGFGDNPQAQARWQASVSKQLDALRAYQSTPADCEMPTRLATPPTGR